MKSTSAKVLVNFKNLRETRAAFNALKPEIALPPSQRSNVKISRKRRSIQVTFEAKDIVALRASMNAILRYILGFCKTTTSLKELERELLVTAEMKVSE